jgi:hypothetical protein
MQPLARNTASKARARPKELIKISTCRKEIDRFIDRANHLLLTVRASRKIAIEQRDGRRFMCTLGAHEWSERIDAQTRKLTTSQHQTSDRKELDALRDDVNEAKTNQPLQCLLPSHMIIKPQPRCGSLHERQLKTGRHAQKFSIKTRDRALMLRETSSTTRKRCRCRKPIAGVVHAWCGPH